MGAAAMTPASLIKWILLNPAGDRKVAWMAGKRKRDALPAPNVLTVNTLVLPRRTLWRTGGGDALLLQLALQRFDLILQGHVLADQRLDLAYGMQNRGVIAATEAAADFRQRA